MARTNEVELHIVIQRNGGAFLDAKKIDLLNEIHHSGSLRSAATLLGISYQHAWNLLHELNRAAGQPLVVSQRGGPGGGGALLTEYGKHIIEEYRILEMEIQTYAKRLNTEINL
jgi:molybdate transport system regulatory protein